MNLNVRSSPSVKIRILLNYFNHTIFFQTADHKGSASDIVYSLYYFVLLLLGGLTGLVA